MSSFSAQQRAHSENDINMQCKPTAIEHIMSKHTCIENTHTRTHTDMYTVCNGDSEK